MNQKKPLNESFERLDKMLPPNMKQKTEEKKQKENEEPKRVGRKKDKNEK